MEIYKRNQGKHTRWLTFAGVLLITLVGAYELSEQLRAWLPQAQAWLRYTIPAVLVALITLVAFWVINRPKTADFLIATESEMKKVSWSSRKEVVGSTKVVIVTTLILAVLLFGVDYLFQQLFQVLGVTAFGD